ncbi:MAG TPA: cupin domain-containing protein, partial [Nitrososphaerales archaeon]|nr:cupin domain-containing protein [Nitrososphaerales archaeon]
IGSGWGFLKKGMKIEPHKHSVKEIYIIIGGKGFMKVANNTVTIQKGDAIYIPSNDIHTAWNKANEDLEFIYIAFENQPLPFIMNIFERSIELLKNLFVRSH